MQKVLGLLIGIILLLGACNSVLAMNISDAKLLPDGSSVSLSDKVVTYVSGDYFYIEEDSRFMGIRVEKTTHGLSVGMRADVTGHYDDEQQQREIHICIQCS